MPRVREEVGEASTLLGFGLPFPSRCPASHLIVASVSPANGSQPYRALCVTSKPLRSLHPRRRPSSLPALPAYAEHPPSFPFSPRCPTALPLSFACCFRLCRRTAPSPIACSASLAAFPAPSAPSASRPRSLPHQHTLSIHPLSHFQASPSKKIRLIHKQPGARVCLSLLWQV